MAPDMVNHPPHYETNGIECIDAMRASQGDEVTKNFCVCNAFKYIWRSTHKGSEIQDLEKAIWYLNKAIEIGKQAPDPNADTSPKRLEYVFYCKHDSPTCYWESHWFDVEIQRTPERIRQTLMDHLTHSHGLFVPQTLTLEEVIDRYYEKEILK